MSPDQTTESFLGPLPAPRASLFPSDCPPGWVSLLKAPTSPTRLPLRVSSFLSNSVAVSTLKDCGCPRLEPPGTEGPRSWLQTRVSLAPKPTRAPARSCVTNPRLPVGDKGGNSQGHLARHPHPQAFRWFDPEGSGDKRHHRWNILKISFLKLFLSKDEFEISKQINRQIKEVRSQPGPEKRKLPGSPPGCHPADSHRSWSPRS